MSASRWCATWMVALLATACSPSATTCCLPSLILCIDEPQPGHFVADLWTPCERTWAATKRQLESAHPAQFQFSDSDHRASGVVDGVEVTVGVESHAPYPSRLSVEANENSELALGMLRELLSEILKE